MTLEKLESRVKEIVGKYLYVDREDGGMEIYCDYNDELSIETIKGIILSDEPLEAFYETLSDWAEDYAIDYGWNEFEREIKKHLSDEELECWQDNESEIYYYLQENYYFYYPVDHFNKNVKVNIMVDCGNMNTDFTEDNVLNWDGIDGGYGNKGKFPKYSSMLWLAKTQGKAEKLQNQVKIVYDHVTNENIYDDFLNRPKEEIDKFVESCIQEMENLPNHMGTVTFLVSMPLFDLFALKKAIKSEEKLNKFYTPEPRKGVGYIILDKTVMCGLYDPWQGGGSVLEIELDKDVKLPIKYIFSVGVDGTKEYGYDIGDVYGLCSDAWEECLKEVHYMTEEEIKILEK